MTVIAYDGTTLASDRMVSFEDGSYFETTKVFRRDDGTIFGVAGEGPCAQEVQDWFMHGGNPSDFPDCDPAKDHVELLYISPNELPMYLLNSAHPIPVESLYFAIGCGAQAALVLMDMGLTAELAVQKVCERNLLCGGGPDVLRVGS